MARQQAGHDVSPASCITATAESSQYRAIRYTERLAETAAVASAGSKGDSYDNAMAEAFNSLFKAECIRNPRMRPAGGWKSVGDVEIAVVEYVDWFNHRRLHGEIGLIPPAELEATHQAGCTALSGTYRRHYEARLAAGTGRNRREVHVNKADLGPIYQRIAEALIEVAPEGWVELKNRYVAAGKTSEQQARAIMADGSEQWLWGEGPDLMDALADLRQLNYRPGVGTWYTALVTVTRDGQVSADFHYDNEPEWDVVPGSYVEDLEMYPRDEANRPGWLQEKIRQASESN